LQLPIVYEEELATTQKFLAQVDGRTSIIIPHLGILNGGYNKLKNLGVSLKYFISPFAIHNSTTDMESPKCICGLFLNWQGKN
jgi:hypothetical protein